MGIGFRHVEREPVYMQVAEQIRQAILSGEIVAGEPLPAERELAERLGVGRASVREAIRALQAQGLVIGSGRPPARMIVGGATNTAARDALVHLLHLQVVSLEDLVVMREVLETKAATLAAQHPRADSMEEARAALEVMSSAGADLETFDQADVRFHIALVRGSGNEAMHLVMQVVRDAMQRYLLNALRSRPEPTRDVRRLTHEHREILRSVESGDGEKAARLVARHIARFYGPNDSVRRPQPGRRT